MINVNGTPIDFSQDRYQLQSRLIHVEGGDRFTLHRHTDRVPFGEFLRSVGMRVENNCFVISGENFDQQVQQQQQAQEREYCSDGLNDLRAFVNGNELEPPSSFSI